MYLFIFLTLYMFRAHRAHQQKRQTVSVQPLVAVTVRRWLCRVQVRSELPTCTQHGHWHRVTATRGCIDTICHSWWWAQCARNTQRVKNKDTYIEKNCASHWSFNKNHYMMHSQQNIKVIYVWCHILMTSNPYFISLRKEGRLKFSGDFRDRPWVNVTVYEQRH